MITLNTLITHNNFKYFKDLSTMVYKSRPCSVKYCDVKNENSAALLWTKISQMDNLFSDP